MGLFQKKQISNTQPFYSLGLETTLLIVGLGNPGNEYVGTRHNIGFDVVDNFAKKQEFPEWVFKRDLKCILSNHKLGNARIILAKPTSYMNKSGETVQAVQHFYKVDNAKMLVVHDELDVDFGSIRVRVGGKSAGHNGIKSLMVHCGEDFGRIRIGVGPKKPAIMKSEDFVLQKFSKSEEKHLPMLLRETNSILSEYTYGNGQLTPETRSFII